MLECICLWRNWRWGAPPGSALLPWQVPVGMFPNRSGTMECAGGHVPEPFYNRVAAAFWSLARRPPLTCSSAACNSLMVPRHCRRLLHSVEPITLGVPYVSRLLLQVRVAMLRMLSSCSCIVKCILRRVWKWRLIDVAASCSRVCCVCTMPQFDVSPQHLPLHSLRHQTSSPQGLPPLGGLPSMR